MKIAFGENPRRVYGDKQKAPVTRMATAYLIREMLQKAKDYIKKKESKEFTPDFGMDAVLRVLRHEMPLRAHAHRADDIMTALRIAREFDVEIILDHCTEGHLIAEELARRQARRRDRPPADHTGQDGTQGQKLPNPGRIGGIRGTVCVGQRSPGSAEYVSFRVCRSGRALWLSPAAALRAVTVDPAQILGIADRVGRLAPGYDADVVIWSGEPIEMASRAEKIWVGGTCGQPPADNGGAAWQQK